MNPRLRTSLLRCARAAGLLLAAPAMAGTIYVDANLTTGAGDGSSWANAYQGPNGLKLALAAAAAGDEIFVADGRYLPSATNLRTDSFALRNNVRIYGGFLGGEAALHERPPVGAAPSILDGDLAGNDGSNVFTDNSYHVVTTVGTNATALLDGFVVRGGNANAGGGNNDRGGGILIVSGVSPTIQNCRFEQNRCVFGGGAGYINGSAPRFTSCSFIGNVGGSFGGAFDIAQAGAVRFEGCYFEGNSAARAGALEIFATGGAIVVNSVFYDNVATGSGAGGGIWVGSGTSAQIRNCTIVGNRATASTTGGGIANSGASPTVVNCILWDNSGSGGAQTSGTQVSPGTSVTYSNVEFGIAGAGNINVAPMFVDVATRNFDLLPGAPGIDAGNNGGVPTGVIADYARRRRFVDDPAVVDTGAGTAPIVDMGAFEFTTNLGQVFCTSVSNSIGPGAKIDATGSDVLASNDVTLVATQLPQNSNGFFLTSRQQGFVANPGGSSGNLCLTGAIGRYVGPGQVQNSGAAGSFSLMVDLSSLPQPNGAVAAQVGETWNFTAWYRDSILGFATSNFTDGVAVTFR